MGSGMMQGIVRGVGVHPSSQIFVMAYIRVNLVQNTFI